MARIQLEGGEHEAPAGAQDASSLHESPSLVRSVLERVFAHGGIGDATVEAGLSKSPGPELRAPGEAQLAGPRCGEADSHGREVDADQAGAGLARHPERGAAQ